MANGNDLAHEEWAAEARSVRSPPAQPGQAESAFPQTIGPKFKKEPLYALIIGVTDSTIQVQTPGGCGYEKFEVDGIKTVIESTGLGQVFSVPLPKSCWRSVSRTGDSHE